MYHCHCQAIKVSYVVIYTHTFVARDLAGNFSDRLCWRGSSNRNAMTRRATTILNCFETFGKLLGLCSNNSSTGANNNSDYPSGGPKRMSEATKKGNHGAKRRLFGVDGPDGDEDQSKKKKKKKKDNRLTAASTRSNTAYNSPSSLNRERVATTAVTPQKNKKRSTATNAKHDFFSPKGKSLSVVTPDNHVLVVDDDEDDEEEPKDEVERLTTVGSPSSKRTRLSDLFSPVKSEKVVVEDESVYIPTYIHKNVSYQRKGQASLSDKVIQTFQLVCSHYDIPEDLETNRIYGPLSGISYEERAIAAYNLSLLKPKNGEEVGVEICSRCVTVGHKRSDCPLLT